MKIETFSKDKEFKKLFFAIEDFCKKAIHDENLPGIVKNMDYRFWANNEHCLLHRIYIQKKFRNEDGCLQLLYDKKQIIGLAGIERYSPDIALGLKRLYILKKYRKNPELKKLFLPAQIKWAKKQGIKVVLLTTNDYNSRIFKFAQILTQTPKSSFPVLGKFKYLGKREICNCIQDVFYYKLDKEFILNAVL